MTFPTKEDEILLSGLTLLTCHPMAKSQAAILKSSWKATSVQRPAIVCGCPHLTQPCSHSRGGSHGRCIFWVKRPVFPLHHSFVDRIRLRNDSTKALRFLEHTMHACIGHNKDDVIVPLYAVYTHQQIFKKSFDRVRLWLRRCRREW